MGTEGRETAVKEAIYSEMEKIDMERGGVEGDVEKVWKL